MCVPQGVREGLQGARDRSRDVVGEHVNPSRIVGLVDHLLNSSFRAVQRHAQLLDVVLSEAGQESAGELALDGRPAPHHPVETPAESFCSTIGCIAVAGCGQRVHNAGDRVSRTPAEDVYGPFEETNRIVGQDHILRDGDPGEADCRSEHEPPDPVARDVPGTGEKGYECADHGDIAGPQTPGTQRVRQEHLQDQECYSGPHRGPAQFDGDNDRHGRDN